MDYSFSEEQAGLLGSIERLLGRYRRVPADTVPGMFQYDPRLEAELTDAGFAGIAREEGFGPLEAALYVIEASKLPYAIETTASALVAPQLSKERIAGPIALVADVSVATRFLPVARTALIVDGSSVRIAMVEPGTVTACESLFGYPMGRLNKVAAISTLPELGMNAAERMKQWWRVGLAAECCGAMRSAVDFTVEHVKNRRQFGRPLASLQVIQHRLAAGAQNAETARWMTLRAAWSGAPVDAAIALTYVQSVLPRVTYDLHQFNGAMGLTLEHPLHYWTYRLKALQSELGGWSAQAREAARARMELTRNAALKVPREGLRKLFAD